MKTRNVTRVSGPRFVTTTAVDYSLAAVPGHGVSNGSGTHSVHESRFFCTGSKPVSEHRSSSATTAISKRRLRRTVPSFIYELMLAFRHGHGRPIRHWAHHRMVLAADLEFNIAKGWSQFWCVKIYRPITIKQTKLFFYFSNFQWCYTEAWPEYFAPEFKQ